MTPQIEDIMRTAPLSFKENTLVKDFLTKADVYKRQVKAGTYQFSFGIEHWAAGVSTGIVCVNLCNLW